jgi:CHAT domain-containing protein
MVAWQIDVGDLAEAHKAIERSRARSLIEQMETHEIDLLAGMPADEARRLEDAERVARVRVTSLEQQLRTLSRRTDLPPAQRKQQQDELLAQLHGARGQLASARGDIRNASPAFRLIAGKQREPAPLAVVRQWVSSRDALLLQYLLGQDNGYVLIVPSDGNPRLEPLAVDQKQAEVLGIQPGPLTAERLDGVLGTNRQTRLVQLLRASADPGRAEQAAVKSAVLWQVLIPREERQAILGGRYHRLIVSVDGGLGRLPFEALAVNAEQPPKYLLDAGPPVHYAPSATILLSLAEREGASWDANRATVLSVGDCRYDGDELLDRLASENTRYASAGGQLQPLPFTKREVHWVAEVFAKQGLSVARLQQEQATERNVRKDISNRRIVHFACHGQVDQAYGNLFGALALTPGAAADDPGNDGFLTLAEIYELDLKGCELAILSACDTNEGPLQRGEGVWALSRGFLVAGARRAVASNWLVDDEAAASLVSFFCSILAKAEAEGRAPDYAEALWRAKRWVRSQEKWKSPYYWAPFVLVGPN